MGKVYIAKRIDERLFEEWDMLAEKHGNILLTVKWGKIFEPYVERIGIFDKEGKLVGGLHYYKYFKTFLKILRPLPYTPHIGPFFELKSKTTFNKLQEQRDIMKAIVSYLLEEKNSVIYLSLSPEVKDTFPFYWANFKVNVRYTYRINLNKTKQEILNSMSSKMRNHINKALKDGIRITEEKNINLFKRIISKTYERQKTLIPWETYFDKILEYFPPGKNSFLLVSWKNESPLYAIYCIYDKRICFNLISGYDYEKKHHGAGALAVYNAILKAKELGLEIFDFEGSMVPSIERFFRGFGGELTPYYTVSKAPLLVEMGLKLVKRQIF